MECTTGVYLEWSHSEKSAGVWSVLSRKLQLFLEWSVPGVTPIIARVSNSLVHCTSHETLMRSANY